MLMRARGPRRTAASASGGESANAARVGGGQKARPDPMVLGVLLWLATGAVWAQAPCGEDDVSVRVVRAEWVDGCRDQPCPVLRAAGEVQVRCEYPVGVRVRLRALDAAGEAVAIGEMWPFGRRNVPPGVHEVSFDQWVGHDPAIADFTAIVTGIVRWPE